ncbi:hypothetical protein CPB86DRAFT_816011 [Serendipita vermifera]|nr:hypothetical protein CPB86DRAFT_816011 [Serendipita vermifera]
MPELVTITFRDLVDLRSMMFLQGSPKLLHLSAEISFLPAIDSMPFSAHLQTLHLSNKLPPPDQVLTALSNLPSLKELLLHDTQFPNRPSTSEQSDIPYPDNLRRKEIPETHGLPTLDLIWIRGYNAHNLSQILIPPFIDSSTNVRVEMVPDRENPLKFNCKKKDIPSSLWVRSWQNGFLLDHHTASTEVIFHSKTDTKIDTEETSMFMIPTFVSPSFIVSLSLDGRGDPPPIALLQKFPNLTRLHFLFVLSLESAALRSISTTLNGNLARSCPQLEFIGLTLRKAHPKTRIPYSDGAEYAVKDFSKSWLEIHGAIFGTVRLQDEIKPARWERHMSTLKNLVRSFELGYMRSQPSFPRARKFDEGFD